MKRAVVLAVLLGSLVLAASAAAASPIAGVYQTTIKGKPAQLNGTWLMTFAGNGFYTIAKKPKATTTLIGGSSAISGKALIMRDSSGPLACKGAAAVGQYSFNLSGKTLKFTKVKDTCDGRPVVLTSGSWTKVR